MGSEINPFRYQEVNLPFAILKKIPHLISTEKVRKRLKEQ